MRTRGAEMGVLVGVGAAIALLTVSILQSTTSTGIALTSTETLTVTTTQTATLSSNMVSASLNQSGAFPYQGANCLFEVPQGAILGRFGAAQADDALATLVTFSNGVNASFPVVGCPQPVGYGYYQLAELAVTNKTFVAMENGSTYYYAGAGPTVLLPGNRSSAALLFNTYGNQTATSGCNESYSVQILGQIQVFFFPSSASSPPVLSDPEYAYASGGLLDACP